MPPPRSGSIEALTAILADGLVGRGCDVTLFATGGSSTRARLHAVYERGYLEDPTLVRNIIADGCDRARDLAGETMREVREAMGLARG